MVRITSQTDSSEKDSEVVGVVSPFDLSSESLSLPVGGRLLVPPCPYHVLCCKVTQANAIGSARMAVPISVSPDKIITHFPFLANIY